MIKTNCEQCNKVIHKLPKDYKKSKHHYCSIRCSNLHKPRRKPEGICKKCVKAISSKRTYCIHCFRGLTVDNLSLEQVAYTKKSAAKYSKVCARARYLYNPTANKPCQKCNYSLHSEVCHIKPISKFPKHTLVKTVNKKSNIAILCRNCHWELDHGVICLD